jgi:predicted DCC family thiol-disulfide oxidoreductase YuxK
MELGPKEVTARTGRSWNPLRCGGTALPLPLLLMAKIVAITFLLSTVDRVMPAPFLPFLTQLDAFADSHAFAMVLQVVFTGSAVLLIFNRWPRASALVMGCAVITAVISSKAYYGNNKLFAGSLLILAGLYHPSTGAWLLRLQLAIVYFGAGLNKALDPDWHSGQFFHNWAGARLAQPIYLWANDFFPHLVLAKLISWFTIATELSLAGVFLAWPRAWPVAIWASLLFHASLLEFTGSTFNMFFYAMEAAMLAFVAWPRELIVMFDGDCGICNRIREAMARFDFEGAFTWRTLQSGIGDRFGIPRAALEERLHLAADGRIASGFRACKLILLYHPAFYLATAVLLAAPGMAAWGMWWRRILAGLLLAFFFPPFNAIGERAYEWVARNRYRFSSGGACAIEPNP